MDEKKQPGIKFENVILKKLDFERKPETPPKTDISMKVEASISLAPDGKMMACELICKIEDSHKSFKVDCAMIGIFSTEGGHENMSLEQFAQTSAPALVFPFLREAIASITTKAGMPPLILPPMNIKAMLKPADDNKEKALP